MAKKAVDVVLLPDEAITERVITANERLVGEFGSDIKLNPQKAGLPHISLAMGCIDDADIIAAGEALAAIAHDAPKKLRIIAVQHSESFSGKVVPAFEVEKTPQLQTFHEEVMKAMRRYFTYDVTAEMAAGGDASESTLDWIRNYPAKSGYANFAPHITIGYGQSPGIKRPIEFGVLRVALCHLGNHCTCRNVLWSVEV